MTARQRQDPREASDPGVNHNEVRLVGRVANDPVLRELPSGDSVWLLRVTVQRPAVMPGGGRPRQRSDSIECSVWSGRLRTAVAGWREGDVVEVTGALRRRFFRAEGSTASRVEVELGSGRRVRRAGSG